MYRGKTVALLLPARDEAEALPSVLGAVPSWVDRVLVLDNGSTDATATVASRRGAQVVFAPVPGYGSACLAGLLALDAVPPDVVVFADADGSDDLSRLVAIVDPVARGEADLVLARRVPAGPGALSLQQRVGNWLATRLIRLVWGHPYADLGPMRAIAWPALRSLGMGDRGSGWTVEMQVRAVSRCLRVREVAVAYRPRLAGRSKISRTLVGSLRAGAKILAVIAREAWRGRRLRPSGA